MVPVLYMRDYSPPSRAVMMTAKAIGLELELKEIDTSKGEQLTEEFLKINPQHTVPTLDDNGFILTDSHAIVGYLIGKYAKDDSLYPKDIQKRALVDEKLHFDTGSLFPLLVQIASSNYSTDSIMAPILYMIDISPPCRAVLMTAKAIGLQLELKEIDTRKGEHLTEEFLKINPQHTIPTLDDNGFILTDSHAIVSYLVGKYARDDSLYPKDIQKRALVDEKLYFDTGSLFPLLRQIACSSYSTDSIMAPILYMTDISPPCRAVLMTAKAIGLQLVLKEIDTKKGEQLTEEFLKINPQHTLPTLDDNGFILTDSHAIVSYLVGKYARDDSLYPKDIQKRALVDEKLYFDTGSLFILVKQIAMPIFKEGQKQVPVEKINQAEEKYQIIEKYLEGKNWLVGESPTVADFSLVATITSLQVFANLNEKRFKNVIAWLNRVSMLDCYSENDAGAKKFAEIFKELLGQ